MTEGEVAETDVVRRRVAFVGDIRPPLLKTEPSEDSEDIAEDLLANGWVDAWLTYANPLRKGGES